MKPGEKGFTLIELLVAITITVLASGAAGAAIFQVVRSTEGNNDHITVSRQVQNAGYHISRDAQMAYSVSTDNLPPLNFLELNWTVWDDAGNAVYHYVTYFFEDLTDGIGKLKRSHFSAGVSDETLIAEYIYYEPSDVNNTSNVTYESSVLTVKLTTILGDAQETREYKTQLRPNY